MRGVSPRRRSVSLGEPEALNLPVSITPRHGLLRLDVGPHLGEGPLHLSEPKVLFFLSFLSLIL